MLLSTMSEPLNGNRQLERFTRKKLKPADVLLDIGAGIRPYTQIECKRHICVEPHKEYADILMRSGYEVLNLTALDALTTLTGFDTVLLLDVIEHMDKEEGKEVIRLAKEKARQVAVFTPLGFMKQSFEEGEKDPWGYSGMHWQTHRSGWMPGEFKGWRVYVDENFHKSGYGAFTAIWRKSFK